MTFPYHSETLVAASIQDDATDFIDDIDRFKNRPGERPYCSVWTRRKIEDILEQRDLDKLWEL
ncbi:hypothetical protein L1D34_11220 [Vibrio mediterranei]|uniref:hypothetical protein n=1 Tax=Vibrio mediterranei TaxID=689 RepID=UPI001EFD6462|nr:hypothetical protein [Vibrio mediterranei]MCG9625415.1 hypothetical protein [Vibrio mediterranei]